MPPGRAESDRRWIGRTVAEKYELLRVVGVGGMGTVYEGVHRYTGKHVAVKLIHGALAASAEHVARFLREAKAASDIGHPAIVDVFDAGETSDRRVYLAMELLKGEDLDSALQRGLPVDELVHVVEQVLDCLDEAHRHGIVHRDIKPENIYLARSDDGRSRVRVLDFGIAKHLRAEPDTTSTAEGMVIGTPDFMSREQARGAEVDGRTDVWSAGALLFYGLTGRPPFVAANYNLLMVQILTEDPPGLGTLRPDLPAALAAIVDRALCSRPGDRWQTAGEMAKALSSSLSSLGSPVPARASATADTLSAPGVELPAAVAPRRPRLAWMVLMTASVVLALAAAVALAVAPPAPTLAPLPRRAASATPPAPTPEAPSRPPTLEEPAVRPEPAPIAPVEAVPATPPRSQVRRRGARPPVEPTKSLPPAGGSVPRPLKVDPIPTFE